MTEAETIERSGRRLGAHAWVASRLFEVTGRWSGTVGDARARVLLGRASRRFGGHAERWIGLLPALPHLPAAELVSAPVAGQLVDALDALEAVDADESVGHVDALGPVDAVESVDAGATTDARVRVLADRVLPAVLGDLEAHLAVTSPVADGPVVRALGSVLADVRTERDALSSWEASRPRSGG